MTNPKVSIITPAYNAEKYIGEAIESVLAQTYKDWEHIVVVDGGTTDGTAAVVRRYAARDPRVIYHYDKEHKRMASARNVGIRLARGEYIAFLDADNVFSETKLEAQAAHLDSDGSCGVSYGKVLHFYGGARDVLWENKNEAPLRTDQLRGLLWRNSINLLAVLVRKECFDRWGAFPEGWAACDEHYVWINLASRGVRFCHIEKMVGLSRLHIASDSRRKDHILDTANLFLKMLDSVEKTLPPEQKREYGRDFKGLRRSWKIKRFIGILLNNRFTSPLLLPLYLARRERTYAKVS
ncbi:MAG: glycosyltransferase [Candidatus Liptonbacteria bacterium]|nr:glycosyltransferase [Candidatus Liptonbacteria bacterium]